MSHAPQRVIEIVLDELARALRLPPEMVDHCRRELAELLRPRRPVLFLAAGDVPPDRATIESFRALTALGVQATLVRSHSFAQTWPAPVVRAQLGAVALLDDLGADEIRRLPDRFPLLCILTLSDNTVAKSVLGLRDAVPPRILRAFLERGRPVIAAGTPPQRLAFDQSSGVFWGLPQTVRQWLSEGYRTLEQWGVQFVEPDRLIETARRHLFPRSERREATTVSDDPPDPGLPASASDHASRSFVTVEDIRAAHARGEREIRIAPNATVTDEAREFAARWGILLLE